MTTTLTASEFLERLQVGTLPTEQYSVMGDVHFGDAIIWRTIHFGNATFMGDVFFGGATFEMGVFFRNATFNGGVIFGGATFEKDVHFGNASLKWRAYTGSNPAIGWLFEKYNAGIAYTTADARHMCGHPRPMHGWERRGDDWALEHR